MNKTVHLIGLFVITTSSAYSWDPIGDIKKGVDKVVKEAGNAVTDTVKTVTTGKPHGDIAKAAAPVVDKVVKETGNAVTDTVKTVATGQPHGDIAKAAAPVVDKVVKETGNAVTDTIKTVTTGQPHGDIAKAAAPVVEVIGNAAVKVVKEVGNGIDDTFKTIQTGKPHGDIAKAAVASGRFLENQTKSLGETLTDADKRIREGKLIDAIWHVATDPVKHTEKNFGKAVDESSLLSDVASAAASIYGGPSGAAAYASWLTYKRTGDLELALRAGVLAGATAQGVKIVNGMPSGNNTELIKKTLASASIGGAAVAASGGDEKSVTEAFVTGAALTLAREHYKSVTNSNIDGKAPTNDALAKQDPTVKHQFTILVDDKGKPILDSNGNTQIDIRSMPKSISHVGLATANHDAGLLSGEETSKTMQAIAKLPYMNDMAYYHDQWMAITQTSGVAVQATILPAAALTVTGSDIMLNKQATETNIDSNKMK